MQMDSCTHFVYYKTIIVRVLFVTLCLYTSRIAAHTFVQKRSVADREENQWFPFPFQECIGFYKLHRNFLTQN